MSATTNTMLFLLLAAVNPLASGFTATARGALSHRHHATRRPLSTSHRRGPTRAAGTLLRMRAYEPVIQDEVTTTVYFDIAEEKAFPSGGITVTKMNPLGRIEMGLYGNVVPKTALNFKELCEGCESIVSPDKQIGYKGSAFHRVIPDFM
jgi:hypothetical protein